MNGQDGVRYLTKDLIAWTSGLQSSGHPELRAMVSQSSSIADAVAFLEYVATYIRQYGARIQPGETLAYGYWLTRFDRVERGMLEASELDDEAAMFVGGITRSVRFWRDQHDMCERTGAEFSPPRFSELGVISDGVYEGDPVQGVRYPSPDPMSGWWISTDRYNGDINTMRPVHLHHVTAARPDLTKYLALPHGFRFSTEDGEDVWFDETVAKDDPV